MQYDYVGFITAILIAIGGAIGYFKSGKILLINIYLAIMYTQIKKIEFQSKHNNKKTSVTYYVVVFSFFFLRRFSSFTCCRCGFCYSHWHRCIL